jgi:hypothetical protein
MVLAFAIGFLSGLSSWWYQVTFSREAGDLTWALHAAQDLLAGDSPYLRELPPGMVAYPLPAALVAIPFLVLPIEVAAGVFMGLSALLLAWGILEQGNYYRLLLFVSFPFWQAVQKDMPRCEGAYNCAIQDYDKALHLDPTETRSFGQVFPDSNAEAQNGQW